MGIGTFAKRWLGDVFGSRSKPQESLAGVHFSSPQDVVHPNQDAPIEDHARFLLQARHYIRNHPVPDDRKSGLNQYSHAAKPHIDDDPSIPAITDCSYEFFGQKRISIGFPLFIEQARWVTEDNRYNPAFNSGTLWDSFEKLLKSRIGDLGDGDTKYGYYLPTNHYYIEKPVPQDVFDKAGKIIEFYTRTKIEDPREFLKELDKNILRAIPKISRVSSARIQSP